MATEWSNTVSRLDAVSTFDYFKKKSMPGFVEPLVTELVTSFVSSDADDRNKLLSVVSPALSDLLGWYARKLAGRAVREGSQADLWNGLIAMAISTSRGDFRDAMAPLSLLYNSAIRLKEDPQALFMAASKTSTHSVVELFEGFLKRPTDQKSIGVCGFSEGVGPDGFDYLPLLPEFGGPTPF